MKKLILFITLLSLPFLAMSQTKTQKSPASKPNKCIEAQVKTDDVKMYRQAGTSSEIVATLKKTDQVLYHRKLNNTWAVVTLDDKVGYVLYGELTNRVAPAPETPVVALQKKRK
ncbi:SH3 domain-containing protein [Rufibacter latericius]|uniref:SH3 domain-containing protein n=1 Tax=Rufibacter latericius TaxID=2487040 RepID=A0A3M9MBY8_9BACT|nr:SH3 domain-containing protein [Rufibacter latericius]RNI22695.1 SH3 domain-containing protein [Rufibacter latericius]